MSLADIAVAAAPRARASSAGLPLSFTVTNRGPWVAPGVTATLRLPPGVKVVSATPAQGECVVSRRERDLHGR